MPTPRPTLLILLSIGLALAVAGCAVIRPAGALPVTAEQVRERVLQAAEAVDTVRFEMDMTVAITGSSNRRVEMNLAAGASGLVDNAARKAQTETKATLTLPGGNGTRETTAVSYVVGGVLYTQASGTGRAPSWVSTSLPAGSWAEVSQFGREIELLRQGQITLLGSDQVGDTPCYVLAIKPDTAKMEDSLKQISGLMDLPEGNEADLGQMVRGFSSKVWVATDTFLPLKDETELTMVVDSGSIGLSPGTSFELKLRAQVRTRFYDYNQPLAIELPAEARGARHTS